MAFSDRFRNTGGAQTEFADRVGEQEAFDRSIENYVSVLADVASGQIDPTDLDRPRNNVLVYYGIGGIGKSSLLNRLIDRLEEGLQQPRHWPPPIPYASPVATCRIDASDFDPEDAILTIRASLVALGRPMKAFDMCIGRYWSYRHGNTDIAEMFRHRGRLRRVGDAVAVGDHIQAAIEETCSTVIGTALPGMSAFRAITQVGSTVLAGRVAKSTLGKCPHLSELIEDEPTVDMLPQYANALAWDLQQVQQHDGSRFVVFIDTFEEASDRAKQFFNILTWMLPNVLFVVAGRDLVNWATTTTDRVDFVGRDRWPGLSADATTEPRQHLVGYLSHEDRTRWLTDVIGHVCSDDIVDLAARESHGLPVHLDLIAQHILSVGATRTVRPEDAQGDLDVVARRVLRDLTDQQRRALLASSLYRRFDKELLRVTADLPNSGPVVELVSRPYVENLPRTPYDYRLHDLLREVFRSASGLGDDQWLLSDWERAARRGAAFLRERLMETTDPEGYSDHAELLFALVATFGLEFEWLPAVAERVTSVSNWNADWTADPMSGFEGTTSWSTALAQGVSLIMKRQGRNRGEVARDLSQCVKPFPDDRRLDVVRYFLGQAQRDAGAEQASFQTMTGLLDGSMARLAVKGLIHVHRRRGDFDAALRLHAEHRQHLHYGDRLLGELLWTQGLLDESIASYLLGAERARQRSDGGELALCLASMAWCHALRGDSNAADRLVQEARVVLRITYQSFADLMTGLAEGFTMALNGDPEILQRVEDNGSRAGQTSIVAYARFARCMATASASDQASSIDDLSRLRESVHDGSFSYLWSIATAVAGQDVDPTEWWDPTITGRWKQHAAALRERTV